MKDILKSIPYFLIFLLCVGLAFGTNILLIDLLSVIPIVTCAAKGVSHVKGDMVKDSVFSAYRSGIIKQDGLSHPLKILSFIFDKDKTNRFLEETLTLFTQLKQFDNKGRPMTYKTRSQPLTLQLLRRLEREGYICNLSFQKSGKSRLILEKLFMGRLPNFKKKYQMYNISFNLTDKARNADELRSLLKKQNNVAGDNVAGATVMQQEVGKSDNATISHEPTVEELKQLRKFVLNQGANGLSDNQNTNERSNTR